MLCACDDTKIAFLEVSTVQRFNVRLMAQHYSDQWPHNAMIPNIPTKRHLYNIFLVLHWMAHPIHCWTFIVSALAILYPLTSFPVSGISRAITVIAAVVRRTIRKIVCSMVVSQQEEVHTKIDTNSTASIFGVFWNWRNKMKAQMNVPHKHTHREREIERNTHIHTHMWILWNCSQSKGDNSPLNLALKTFA